MKFDIDKLRVHGGHLDLSSRPTRVDKLYADKAEYAARLQGNVEELAALQHVLYAQDMYSVLLIFQGMDTAGKDGVVRHVMSGINPTGCQVHGFQRPTDEELDHDWMWRTSCRLPERGRIGIFNRSYYEEVLVVRVHPSILRAQRIPRRFVDEDRIWRERCADIVAFEDYLTRNGTVIIKFFLHISRDEQKKRFLERIDDPRKQWKFEEADIRERGHWDDYQQAYRDALAWTSTDDAPWYVVPSDDKKNARLMVSRVVIDTLSRLDMTYPEPGPEHAALLAAARARLVAEGD